MMTSNDGTLTMITRITIIAIRIAVAMAMAIQVCSNSDIFSGRGDASLPPVPTFLT